MWRPYDQLKDRLDKLQTESCGLEPNDVETRWSEFPMNERVAIGCNKFHLEQVSGYATRSERKLTTSQKLMKIQV